MPRVRIPLFLIATATLAFAQTPRTLADYPVHAALDNGFTLAAEYLVRSLPTSNGTLVANDYLVIEVAFFGPPKAHFKPNGGSFALRVNRQKTALAPDPPGSVANSIQLSDWTQKPRLSASAGNDDIMVGTSRTNVPHFPGDPTGSNAPIPGNSPEHDPNVPAKELDIPIDQRVMNVALESAGDAVPIHGLIFFQYLGNTKKLKSLELIYDGPLGKAILNLQ
jgi:hypothetical protein